MSDPSKAARAGKAAAVIVERELENMRKDPGLAKCVGEPLSDEDRDTFTIFWPDCFESTHGGVVMPPENEAQMERLFERFGVPMKVRENSLDMVGFAYDVFCVALEPTVRDMLQFPDWDHHEHLRGWPTEWVDYLLAVAKNNQPEARRLAKQLLPLAPGCKFPPGVRVDDQRKKPGQD